MQPKCCARIARADNSYLSAMGAHGRREGPGLGHVDAFRTHRNLFGMTSGAKDLGCGAEYPEKIVARYLQANGIQVRKNSAVAIHAIVIVSPSFFEKPQSVEMSSRDYEASQAKRVLDHLIAWSETEQFPGDLLCWRVDLDETTPHIDLFIVPTYTKKTKSGDQKWVSINKRLGNGGGKAAMSILQTNLATALFPLGIVRGDPKSITGAVHVPPRVFNRLVLNQQAAEVAARCPIEDRVPEECSVSAFLEDLHLPTQSVADASGDSQEVESLGREDQLHIVATNAQCEDAEQRPSEYTEDEEAALDEQPYQAGAFAI